MPSPVSRASPSTAIWSGRALPPTTRPRAISSCVMKRIQRKKRLLRKDRGSALLVSLMVIVGLSLLGLGFVAISETESAISKNQQSALQTQAIAEAGARLVVEWFQNPQWGIQYAGMPQNSAAVAAVAIP